MLAVSILLARNDPARAADRGDAATTVRHALTIEDVLGLEHLDQVTVSPDGEWIAAVVQRPATKGEVYGRTAYETDPSRNDIRLVSRRTREQRNITNGAPLAAGFWCAAWSPDGKRLAMLSTRPEGNEPRGGDNVRLYLWDRDTDRLTRLSDTAVMTQTRYGGAIHRLNLRGGADGGSLPNRCGYDENPPFLWLDDHRLLAVTLPDGQISGLLDEASRPYRVAADDAQRLHDGDRPTVEAVGSGDAHMPPPADAIGIIRTIDVATGTSTTIAPVPAYPFRGDLTLAVSPDGRRVALLATIAAFAPEQGRRFPHGQEDGWTAEKRLGVVDLDAAADIRWLTLPRIARYPLELFGWSPDGRHIAFRARSGPFDPDPRLLIATPDGDRIVAIDGGVMDAAATSADAWNESQLIWLDSDRMLAKMRSDGRADWRLIGRDGSARPLPAPWKEVPAGFRRRADGKFVGIADAKLYQLDPKSLRATAIAELAGKSASFLSPTDPVRPAHEIVIATTADDGVQTIRTFASSGTPETPPVTLAAAAHPILVSHGGLLWQQADQTGPILNETGLARGASRPLLTLNTGLGSVLWGQTRIIDYRAGDGTLLKGAVILPPDYRPGRRYPTLLWVYEGHRVRAQGEYWLDPQMPGLYNLQLYAARGYVILVPSMPLPGNAQRRDVYSNVAYGVMPAIDALVAMGIADPDRLGVMGQSFGGYSVYALITQSDRFKAAVAMAGVTDIIGFYGQFDPLARGYPGIAHEKSANWIVSEQFGLRTPPAEASAEYWRNSPLAYVDRVRTPLLMIHGEHDIRGSAAQAELFFQSLYAQGKTARLLRYGGESHSLAQSPANVRDALRETIGWFDLYLKPGEGR